MPLYGLYSTVLILFISSISVSAKPYENLIKNYSRSKSSVMVRMIRRPTLANLDYAAYINNNIRFDPSVCKPKHSRKASIKDMTFDSALTQACIAIEKTPLSMEERENPVAWVPLQNRLWQQVKTNAFDRIAAKINGYKWSDKSISRPYQEVAAAYLHQSGDETELWVKVEFAAWVDFLQGINDRDNNGQKEIYGKLSISSIERPTVEKSFQWVRSEYMGRELKAEEIVDWANVLASYWYPTLNTDMVDMSAEKKWPTTETPQSVIKELAGLVIDNPAAVMCGKPFGKPLYNVFVVVNTAPASVLAAPEKTAPSADTAVKGSHAVDSMASWNFKENNARFAAELAQHGGDYGAWARENADVYKTVRGVLSALPPEQMGFAGVDGWLFFRKEINYMFAGDLSRQSPDKNPLPHIAEFKKTCAKNGIDLLFVAVPNKSDVYYDKLSASIAESTMVINPFGRKFLRDLQDAGVEVIDVLPLFLKAKNDDKKSLEPLYQKHDTHWTNRGLQIVASAITTRIREYGWFNETKKSSITYLFHDTTFSRLGDIVDKLPADQRGLYPPPTLQASQIRTTDGALYKQTNRSAPITLIGDSFTGVFEFVDCKSAGVGANIAALTSLPVDIITSWGGGPLVREKMIRSRMSDLIYKRLIIYMMVARDLYNYDGGWGK